MSGRATNEWRVERAHDSWVEIREGYGFANRMVADCVREDQAQLIVTAVNNHHTLLDACKDALERIGGEYPEKDFPEPTHTGSCNPEEMCDGNCMDRYHMMRHNMTVRQLREAIAKVKETTHE